MAGLSASLRVMSRDYVRTDTIKVIAQAIESNGFSVKRIGNVSHLLGNFDKLNVDIVFNISEGLIGRNRESQVPMLLEMAGVPFVGADALSLGISLDKLMSKKIFIRDETPAGAARLVIDSLSEETLQGKARKLFGAVFPSPAVISLKYSVPLSSKKLYLYYLRRPFDLFLKHRESISEIPRMKECHSEPMDTFVRRYVRFSLSY